MLSSLLLAHRKRKKASLVWVFPSEALVSTGGLEGKLLVMPAIASVFPQGYLKTAEISVTAYLKRPWFCDNVTGRKELLYIFFHEGESNESNAFGFEHRKKYRSRSLKSEMHCACACFEVHRRCASIFLLFKVLYMALHTCVLVSPWISLNGNMQETEAASSPFYFLFHPCSYLLTYRWKFWVHYCDPQEFEWVESALNVVTESRIPTSEILK